MRNDLLEATDDEMAKSKRKPAKPEPPKRDQKFLVISPPYLDALRAVKAKDGRNMNVSAMMALEMYFRAMGVPFEENFTGRVDELMAKAKPHK